MPASDRLGDAGNSICLRRLRAERIAGGFHAFFVSRQLRTYELAVSPNDTIEGLDTIGIGTREHTRSAGINWSGRALDGQEPLEDCFRVASDKVVQPCA